MVFSEETNHSGRILNCGWGPRAEAAEQIARRLQAMAGDLRRAAPELNALWPQFDMRALRPSDPGPVDALSIEDLGRLIDRRGRFDPPQLPAPVGPWGYKVSLSGPSSLDQNLWLDGSLYAGSIDAVLENRCVLEPYLAGPIWDSVERGRAMLLVLIRAWEPDWAFAWASLPRSEEEEREGRVMCPVRPWLAWQKPDGNPIPYEFIDIGAPSIVHAELGGDLRIWP